MANTYRSLKETYEYRRMQNDTSRFVSNIIPLQNVNSNIGGTDPTTTLSNTVVGLQQMINTDTRTVKANFLQSFTPGAQIGVLSGLNLCNVGITSNGSASAFSGINSNLVVSTLTANTITVTTSGTFGGICYAQQFVTLSDMLAKKDMRPLESVLNGIDKIQAYRFSYSGSSEQTLGLLAQEVEAIFPELVIGSASSPERKYVNYDGVVAVLLKAVQELSERVRALESKN
jgi:hypothetical protein